MLVQIPRWHPTVPDPLVKPHSTVHCYCLVLVQIPWWNPTVPFIVTVLCWFRSPGETPQCRSSLLSCVGSDPPVKPHSAVHCYCFVLVQIPWWNPTVPFIVTVLCWFRSPGGTPLRSLNGPRSPQEPLHKALVMVLRQKFRNARTPSPLTTSSTTSVFSPDATISKNNSLNATFSPWPPVLVWLWNTFLS